MLPLPDVQTVLGQSREHLADAGRLLLDHAVGAAADGRKLFGGRHAGEIAAADFGRPAPHQPGHSHQEELVEVRADDGQKLQPFQQRQVVGQPFLQHAMVELQPAQLAVDVQVWRFQRVLGHDGVG